MSRPWAGPYDELDIIDTRMLAAMFEPNSVVEINTQYNHHSATSLPSEQGRKAANVVMTGEPTLSVTVSRRAVVVTAPAEPRSPMYLLPMLLPLMNGS